MPEKYVIVGDSKTPEERDKIIEGLNKFFKEYKVTELTEAEKRIFEKSCLVAPEERDRLSPDFYNARVI